MVRGSIFEKARLKQLFESHVIVNVKTEAPVARFQFISEIWKNRCYNEMVLTPVNAVAQIVMIHFFVLLKFAGFSRSFGLNST